MEGSEFSYQVPNNAFIDSDATETLFYTLTLSDGSPLPQWIAVDNSNRMISGIPSDQDVGQITISIYATDQFGAFATDEFTLTVIAIVDPIELLVSSPQISSNDSITITEDIFQVSQSSSTSISTVFTVDDVVGGQFELLSSPGVEITTFTKLQIEEGEVLFKDDGDTNPPTYTVYVSDDDSRTQPIQGTFVLSEPVLLSASPVESDFGSDYLVEPNKSQALTSVSPVNNEQTQTHIISSSSIDAVAGLYVDDHNINLFSSASDDDLLENAADGSSTYAVLKLASVNTSFHGQMTSLLEDNASILQLITAPFDIDPLSEQIRLVFQSDDFNDQLTQMKESISNATTSQKIAVGTTAMVASGFSVSYVIWLIRGGVLVSTVLSSLPAWQFIDPLPVLSGSERGGNGEKGDESLQDIIRNSKHDASDKPPVDQKMHQNSSRSHSNNRPSA